MRASGWLPCRLDAAAGQAEAYRGPGCAEARELVVVRPSASSTRAVVWQPEMPPQAENACPCLSAGGAGEWSEAMSRRARGATDAHRAHARPGPPGRRRRRAGARPLPHLRRARAGLARAAADPGRLRGRGAAAVRARCRVSARAARWAGLGVALIDVPMVFARAVGVAARLAVAGRRRRLLARHLRAAGPAGRAVARRAPDAAGRADRRPSARCCSSARPGSAAARGPRRSWCSAARRPRPPT